MPLFIGISFPFRKGTTAFPEAATDEALIRQSLIQLVLTGRGERVMRPDVGSSALAYIFESNDEFLYQRVEAEIMTLIARYEPRVALTGISVTSESSSRSQPQDKSVVVITISYVVLATRQSDSLSLSLTPGGLDV